MNGGIASLSPEDISAAQRRYPRVFDRTGIEQRNRLLFWVVFVAAVLGGMWQTGFFDVARIVAGLSKIGGVLQFMLPPAHNGWLDEFLYAMVETLAMAFLGTLLAALAAVPLGFLGAKNMVSLWVFHFGLRRFLDILCGVDTLIWAMIFVNVVGLGPFAGIMAIAVSDTGTLAKLYAEAIENVDRRPMEGVRAAGGNGLQVVRFGVLPQVFPVMLSHVLYYFESNTRSATILGVVGAGGIGLQLSDRIRVNNWDEAFFIILLILITVSLIDVLSKMVRLRLINHSNAVY
ncbi:phosphonate ABC transporter, permease protein PhnE [Candidatus Entotheonella serta]|nr:phosphonate ABC transporter, permease protein PhnE [Candidatus Entotheonella serta]